MHVSVPADTEMWSCFIRLIYFLHLICR